MTKALELSVFALMLTQPPPPRVLITLKNKIHVKYVYVVYHKFCVLSGMNQFNQMGIQSMGQRSTPPLPLGPSGNQVSTQCFRYVEEHSLKSGGNKMSSC